MSEIILKDDDIIQTLRMDEVIQIIKQYCTKNKLYGEHISHIFDAVYIATADKSNIRPEVLLYDLTLVQEILHKFSLDSVMQTNA